MGCNLRKDEHARWKAFLLMDICMECAVVFIASISAMGGTWSTVTDGMSPWVTVPWVSVPWVMCVEMVDGHRWDGGVRDPCTWDESHAKKVRCR